MVNEDSLTFVSIGTSKKSEVPTHGSTSALNQVGLKAFLARFASFFNVIAFLFRLR